MKTGMTIRIRVAVDHDDVVASSNSGMPFRYCHCQLVMIQGVKCLYGILMKAPCTLTLCLQSITLTLTLKPPVPLAMSVP